MLQVVSQSAASQAAVVCTHHMCAMRGAMQVSSSATEDQIKKMQDKYGVDGAQHGKSG